MPDDLRNQNQRDQFAVAMALGQRASVWAKQNGVPRRTRSEWSKTRLLSQPHRSGPLVAGSPARRYAAVEYTSVHMLELPPKISHFFPRVSLYMSRQARSVSRSAVMISDLNRPSSAGQGPSWEPCPEFPTGSVRRCSLIDDMTLSDGFTHPEAGGRRQDRSLISSALRPPPFWTREAWELDAGAAEAAGNSHDVSEADAIPNRCDGISPPGENRENVTNEAKVDETAIIIQNKEPVRVAANSGVDPGLDSGQETLGVGRGQRGNLIPAVSPRHDRLLPVRQAGRPRTQDCHAPAVNLDLQTYVSQSERLYLLGSTGEPPVGLVSGTPALG